MQRKEIVLPLSQAIDRHFCVAGYTALGVALALPENGKLYALDISEAYANVGKSTVLHYSLQFCFSRGPFRER